MGRRAFGLSFLLATGLQWRIAGGERMIPTRIVATLCTALLVGAAACQEDTSSPATGNAAAVAADPAAGILEVTYIAAGRSWFYWNHGEDFGTAWRAHGWVPPVAGSSGTAPLGYGENYVSPISFGPDPAHKPLTVYFRKDFFVEDPTMNTGVYLGPNDTGTSPTDPDTDGDGLLDGDEVLGTAGGLDLPALGTNPLRKNILLEYDWFDDAVEWCGPHSHRPTQAQLDSVSTAFADAPVANPDGTTGITVIHDYGQGGAFTGGNRVDDADGVITGFFDAEYQSHKAANFAPNRQGYFHYVLMPHRYDTNSASSGLAEIVGDDMMVSLYCNISDSAVANTIMHELGHNLGLLHGGPTDGTNYKPNYNSVMNYMYQFSGVDDDCTPPGNGVLDYSRHQHIDLDEDALIETNGICGSPNPPWDWNFNGSFESGPIAADVNFDGFHSILADYDDWAALVYDFTPSGAAGRFAPQVVACDNPAPAP